MKIGKELKDEENSRVQKRMIMIMKKRGERGEE